MEGGKKGGRGRQKDRHSKRRPIRNKGEVKRDELTKVSGNIPQMLEI